MATNDEMDVRNRSLRTNRTPNKPRLTLQQVNQTPQYAAFPILGTMAAGASAGTAAGPFAPVVAPTLATIGLGYGLYQNRDKIKTFVEATAPIAKKAIMGIPDRIGRFFGLTDSEEEEVERARSAAYSEEQSQGDNQAVTPKPNENPKNDPKKDPKKPSKIRKAVQWVKSHPKTSIAIAAGGFYPTREWIIKPVLNYVGPSIGNVASYLATGEAPFNIPTVANDSTDLLYKGVVGKVKPSQQIKQPTDTVKQQSTPVDTFKTVPMEPIDSVINGIRFISD